MKAQGRATVSTQRSGKALWGLKLSTIKGPGNNGMEEDEGEMSVFPKYRHPDSRTFCTQKLLTTYKVRAQDGLLKTEVIDLDDEETPLKVPQVETIKEEPIDFN
uniref:Rad60-SLD domain-containing protein n=1 Tax=Steinernema glaseri TaxID=37863 RepID=A0A1I7YZM8_9BILA